MFKVNLANRNLPEDSFSILALAAKRKFEQRNCDIDCNADYTIEVMLDPALEADSFALHSTEKGVELRSNNVCTVFAGLGHFLVKSRFDKNNGFIPAALPISHKQRCSLRGMYFASHFYNFYHVAPIEEVYEIIDDLALRGCNALMLCFGVQHFTSTKTPEAQKMISRLKEMFSYAARIGIAPAIIQFTNTSFQDTPKHLQAAAEQQGEYISRLIAVYNYEICPSLPGGMDEIERQQREFLEAFSEIPIKYFALWPYDEGGCTCPDCAPWSTNGFMRVCALTRRLIDEYYKDAEMIISTWHFDRNLKDEWEAFYKKLAEGEYDWASYIMTAFQNGQLPRCIKNGGVPEGVRLIDFPEISMWGAKPWGGFGANPIPMFLENANTNCGTVHDGGFPYSEGIFEDINKWLSLGYYTGLYENNTDALRDYIRFEYWTEDTKDTEDILRAIQLSESTLRRGFERLDTGWRFPIRDGTAVREVHRIITTIDKTLPKSVRASWKWRILYLRAVIDYELLTHNYTGKESQLCQECFHELNEIFHTHNGVMEVHPPEGK